MSNEGGRPDKTADRIRGLRLWLHRKFDELYDRVTDPDFTGMVGIEIHSKNGRPGDPRVKEERYGVTEL